MRSWRGAVRYLQQAMRRFNKPRWELISLPVIVLLIGFWAMTVIASIYPEQAKPPENGGILAFRQTLSESIDHSLEVDPTVPAAPGFEQAGQIESSQDNPQIVAGRPSVQRSRPQAPAAGADTAGADNSTIQDVTPEKPSAVEAEVAPGYKPREASAPAHPTNYGERVTKDVYGRPVSNQAIVVLHETVASAQSTVRFFQTPHYKDNDQASYHALITLDGTVVYLVPPEKRAYGAGNSVFDGPMGPEAVKTHPKFPASVNNFAYHIALETPPSGHNNNRRHSGYTEAQYRALAWLVARTQVPQFRITTHQAVDRSGERMDPRSFNNEHFLSLLRTYAS